MEFTTREKIIDQIENNFSKLMTSFNLDEIGIFEEEGPENKYFLGYTVKKNDISYMIHQPYKKSTEGELAPLEEQWTIETDEPNYEDKHGYKDINEFLSTLN